MIKVFDTRIRTTYLVFDDGLTISIDFKVGVTVILDSLKVNKRIYSSGVLGIVQQIHRSTILGSPLSHNYRTD